MKVLPLYDRYDNFLDWALVDDDDFERAEQYKWRRESYERKDREPRQYAFATINKIRTRLHHFVLGWPTVDEDVIDHRNQDGLDNMKVNLRQATGRQNGQNALKPWDSLSDYIGVSPRLNSFHAMCGGVYLGLYATERDAAIAHDQAAVISYGPMALTNGLESEPAPSRIGCRLDRNLPTGVTRILNAKARPFLTQCNKSYVGAYATADDAHAAYITAKLKDEASRRQKIFALPIQRNLDGVAIISIFNKDGTPKRDILCDDDVWHDLMLYRWYDASGYCSATIDQVNIKMHCFLMKSNWIDHRDGNKDDNRSRNLRKITRSGNSQNTHRASSDVPEYQGVYTSRSGERFEAVITCNGLQQYLGSFRTKEAAALAYNKRALDLFDSPKLNHVDVSTVQASDDGVKVRAGASRFRGVSPNKKRWKTFVQKDKVMHAVGSWMTQEEAALAYNFMARILFENPRCNDVTFEDAKTARQAAFDLFFRVSDAQPRGVSRVLSRFAARTKKNGRDLTLGYFDTAKEASDAYREDWMQRNFQAYDEQIEGFSIEGMNISTNE